MAGKLRPKIGALAASALLAAVVCACGTGSKRVEVPTPSGGVLDCPDEQIAYATYDVLAEAEGRISPDEAIAAFDVGRPEGTPHIEAQDVSEATYVFVDEDGNRLGRGGVENLPEQGWFVTWSEKCGVG